MKKKFIALLLISILTLSGCGNAGTAADNSGSDTKSTQAEQASNALEDIEAEENLLPVELTIPADYVGESTQEELDELAKEKGYESITLNDDGSATYVMTKAQHKEMMKEIEDTLISSFDDMVGSEDYPNFTDITVNSDFTEFTITTTSTEPDMGESFSVLAFYIYGGMYNVFNGTSVDNIHVDFVNEDTGEVIYSCDSSDM